MAAPELLYAKSGGPPEDWANLRIYVNGIEHVEVIIADVRQGFVTRYVGPKMHNGSRKIMRIRGKVEVQRWQRAA